MTPLELLTLLAILVMVVFGVVLAVCVAIVCAADWFIAACRPGETPERSGRPP